MKQLKFYLALSCLNLPLWFKSKLIRDSNFDLANSWTNLSIFTGYTEYINRIKDFNEWSNIEQIILYAEKNNIKIITPCDLDYPELLKNINDFPPVLFVKGNTSLLGSLNISIVGSRKMTLYGKSIISMFIPELVKAGFCTVSGMAKGIDSEVHSVTMQNNGNTIAVLGSGLDVIYPVQNRNIYNSIINNNGVILSEFTFGTPPLKHHFPQRNRIIAGLSKGVVVVEAGKKSGSLITASLAESYSRDVFSIPGPINSCYYQGNNNLIKRGAIVTLGVSDIFEHYELLFKSIKTNNISTLTDKAKNLLKMIDPKGIDLNELLMLSGLPLVDLYSVINELEQDKKIARDEFGIFFLT